MASAHIIIAEAIAASPYNMGLTGDSWLATEGHIPVVFDDGGVALFEDRDDNIFEVHFLLKARGREAIEQVRSAFRTMFNEHGAALIYGLIPSGEENNNRKMKMVARWAGAKSGGLRDTIDGPCELFTITNLRGVH